MLYFAFQHDQVCILHDIVEMNMTESFLINLYVLHVGANLFLLSA